MNKVQKVYSWYTEFFSDPSIESNWLVDGYCCSNCGFPLNSFSYYNQDHPVKYCPGCGGFIEGVKNPHPPVKEKHE